MSDERYDNIEYNEEWQSVPVVRAEPAEEYDEEEDIYDDEYPDDENAPEQDEVYKHIPVIIKPNAENSNPQPVIKMQFFLAFLVVAGAFLLKNFGGELYTKASEWYFDNLNNSLVITMKADTEGDEQATVQSSTLPTEIATMAQPATENTATETQQPTESSTIAEPTEESTTDEEATEFAEEAYSENTTDEETTDEQNITDEGYIED
ncbi:MAG: hypothetical protein U0M12_04335 [Acutalibacteraceae bacterium]|nr:hypothetical protein [Acutalibacteraceae bacterium]